MTDWNRDKKIVYQATLEEIECIQRDAYASGFRNQSSYVRYRLLRTNPRDKGRITIWLTSWILTCIKSHENWLEEVEDALSNSDLDEDLISLALATVGKIYLILHELHELYFGDYKVQLRLHNDDEILS